MESYWDNFDKKQYDKFVKAKAKWRRNQALKKLLNNPLNFLLN